MARKFFVGLVLVLLVAGCASTKQNSEQSIEKQLSLLEEKLQDQQREIADLRGELDSAKTSAYSSNVIVSKKSATSADMTSKNIQAALANAGYYNGAIDGKIGPQTQKAIRGFQADNSLKADGVVGAQTWSKLREYLNAK